MKNALTNNNNVIMVADIDCVIAIEYETSYKSMAIYKDVLGHFWATFAYNDALEQCIEDYESGNFHVTVPGYVEYHERFMAEHVEYLAHFDENQLTDE